MFDLFTAAQDVVERLLGFGNDRQGEAELPETAAALARHAMQDRKIILRESPELQAFEVQCDPEQIQQVLLNLLLNAMQATDMQGEVWLGSFATGEHLRMEVIDKGKGIAREDLHRIFDPFFTTKEQGTGLGLAIAASIVEQHGGSLTCQSEGPGRGSIFRPELPRQAAAHRGSTGREAALANGA